MNWIIFLRDGSMRIIRDWWWRERDDGVIVTVCYCGPGTDLVIETIKEIGPRIEREREVIPACQIRHVA